LTPRGSTGDFVTARGISNRNLAYGPRRTGLVASVAPSGERLVDFGASRAAASASDVEFTLGHHAG
jgi:hypothetical protein